MGISTISYFIIHLTTKLKATIMQTTCLLAVFALTLAVAIAAPEKRSNIFSDLINGVSGEVGQIITCDGKLHREGCDQCCETTTWYHHAEKDVCHVSCKILPAMSTYDTTMDPTNV